MSEAHKFRRILLVYKPSERPHPWQDVLESYADDVTLVSLDNRHARDLMELPADCIIVDGRCPDYDLTGIGILVAHVQHILPRRHVLVFHDERPGWDLELMHQVTEVDFVEFDPHRAIEKLQSFLDDTPAIDWQEIAELWPDWIHPHTVTGVQLADAQAKREAKWRLSQRLW